MIKGLNCLITGGTGFLGREVIAAFLQQGANVCTNYRNKNRWEELKAHLGGAENLYGFPADLTDETAVKELFRQVGNTCKRLDVFIHIAGGFWIGGEIADTPLEKWNHLMSLNLLSTFLCTREAFRLMKAQGGGKIFTVSSKTAEDLPAGMGAYAVSKAAVLQLSQILAKEGKSYNIQVNSLLPGVIDTPANRQAMPAADVSEWVTPQEIAHLLIRLSHPEIKGLSQTALKMYGKL